MRLGGKFQMRMDGKVNANTHLYENLLACTKNYPKWIAIYELLFKSK